MSKKFISMLLGATATCLIGAVLNISDSIIAGVMIGSDAVAAVNLVSPVVAICWFIICMATSGSSIMYTREMGSFNKKKADEILGTSLLSVMTVAVLILGSVLAFGKRYLEFYQPTEQVFNYARDYLFWTGIAMSAYAIFWFFCDMIYADGGEKIATIATFSAAVANVVVSAVLCKLVGIGGIGVGTLVGVIVGMLIDTRHFSSENNSLHFSLVFSFEDLKKALKYAFASSSEYLFMALFGLAINKIVIINLGPEMLIIASVIIFVVEINSIFGGISDAITPIFSVYLKEENYLGVRKIWRLAQIACLAEGFAITVIVLVVAGWIGVLLGIIDPMMHAETTLGIRIMALGMIPLAFAYLFSGYYLIIDRIMLSVAIGMLRSMLIPIATCIVGVYLWGETGLFIGMAIAPFVAYVLTVAYVYIRHGKENYPLLISSREAAVKNFCYEFEINAENVVSVRDKIEEDLKACDVGQKNILRIMLLFEEVFLLVQERNEGKRTLGECAVVIKDKLLTVVTRTDGKNIDLSGKRMNLDSLRSYSLSQLIKTWEFDGKHISTMSFNRNVFEIDLDELGGRG
jgi:Na+-driven multidrug efflux pump